MKDYLIKFFKYNNSANLKVLEAIKHIDNKKEALYLFTHIINSQKKWLYRVTKSEKEDLKWFEEAYSIEKCKQQWEISVANWITYISNLEPEDLYKEVSYHASGGGTYSSLLIDIAIQLNFHSTHHRAQILKIIRHDGVEPPAVDYVFFTRKKLNDEEVDITTD